MPESDTEAQAPLLPDKDDYTKWQELMPVEELPPLLPRHADFYSEPWCGIGTVSIMSALLIFATVGVTRWGTTPNHEFGSLLCILIWSEAAIATLCTAYIIFAGAGIVKRSRSTCYPIPEHVLDVLTSKKSLVDADLTKNVDSDKDGRSYCVRCFLWRPSPRSSESKSHHCSTCQRCVVEFDHHCGVFGRCIVGGNMPCFVALISMMFAGWLTTGIAFFSNAGGAIHSNHKNGPDILVMAENISAFAVNATISIVSNVSSLETATTRVL